MTAIQEESGRLRGELREVKFKAEEDTATLLATILDRMDRQERNMEERLDRIQHQPRQGPDGGQRNHFQGRGRPSHASDTHQPAGRNDQRGCDQTPTGSRWDRNEGDYEDQGTPMDGGDESKGGL